MKEVLTNQKAIEEAIGSSEDVSLNMYAQVRKQMNTRTSRKSRRGKQRLKKLKRNTSDVKGTNTGRFMLGYASTIDKDRAKDVIAIEAIQNAAKDLLQPGANTVFFNHDTDKAIGRVIETAVDEKGLLVKLMISKADDVKDIWTKIKEGVLNAFSIRLRPKQVEVVRDEETHRVTEYRILSMELFEVSVVGLPCNAKCSVTDVIEKSFSGKRNTTGKKNMKDKNGNKKDATAGLTEDRVKELIGDAVSPLGTSLKEMAEAQKNTAAILAKLACNDDAEDKNKEAEGDDSADDTENTLADAVKSLADSVKELKSGRRKGFEGTDEDEDGEGEDGAPKKCLKSATDPDTLKYVVHVCNHSKEYDALSDEEKTLAKGIYIQAVNASQAAA